MSEKIKPIFIVDIDGTVADITHRLHFIQCDQDDNKQDWDAFYAACPGDEPVAPTIATIRLLKKAGALIIMASGRSEAVHSKTLAWFKKHKVPCDAIYMREEGDHRQDAVIKSEFLIQIQATWNGWPILGVFEDRKQCVDMYRGSGLTVFQVADGNF